MIFHDFDEILIKNRIYIYTLLEMANQAIQRLNRWFFIKNHDFGIVWRKYIYGSRDPLKIFILPWFFQGKIDAFKNLIISNLKSSKI